MVAACADGSKRVLVGEVKVTATVREIAVIAARLAREVQRCPDLVGYAVDFAVWVLRGSGSVPGVTVLRADHVVGSPPRR